MLRLVLTLPPATGVAMVSDGGGDCGDDGRVIVVVMKMMMMVGEGMKAIAYTHIHTHTHTYIHALSL